MEQDNIFNNHNTYTYKIAYSQVSPCKRILDFGCGRGEFAAGLSLKAKEVFGVDMNEDLIKVARKAYPFVDFRPISPDLRTPFKDGFFDEVTLLEVLEHVGDEKKLLTEIARILKPNGRVILTTPHKGLFWVFDVANLKFYFPFLHKCIYKIVKKEEYKKKFEQKYYGDFLRKDMKHKHFTQKELRKLLNTKFKLVKMQPFSLFAPFIFIGTSFWEYVKKKRSSFWRALIHLDAKLFQSKLSYSILVNAVKK